MKVLVTGARGQLGRELCGQLGDDAIPLSHDDLELTSRGEVMDAVMHLGPDLLINCAAYTQVDQAEHDEQTCRAVNATAVGCLAEACRQIDCPLVQISTDYVFSGGNDRAVPFRETDTPCPRGIYAMTKLEGEYAAMRYKKHLIIRTCGLYARPSDRQAKNFVSTMLRLAHERPCLRVVNDQQCTPSYAPHVAQAILFLAGYSTGTPAPWGIYHVTNAGATTWYDFAAELFSQANLDVTLEPISTAMYGAAAPRPAYSVLDIDVYNHLEGPAMPHWQAALAEYIEALEQVDVDGLAALPQYHETLEIPR